MCSVIFNTDEYRTDQKWEIIQTNIVTLRFKQVLPTFNMLLCKKSLKNLLKSRVDKGLSLHASQVSHQAYAYLHFL